MVTGDKRGYPISKKRIADDMGYTLNLVSTFQRKEWIEKKFKLEETIYMGDGIYDILVFDVIGLSIAPSNAFFNTKSKANFVTNAKGGEGAVAEACVYLFQNILKIDFDVLIRGKINESGIWKNTNI
jgi:3-deoxy-D-manno-octulosonate 8-phosphate phosphatase (KDO 8-P phosphatase)